MLRDLKDVDLAVDAPGEQVTAAMRSVRAASFDERKNIYLAARIREQQGWYQRKPRETEDAQNCGPSSQ